MVVKMLQSEFVDRTPLFILTMLIFLDRTTINDIQEEWYIRVGESSKFILFYS